MLRLFLRVHDVHLREVWASRLATLAIAGLFVQPCLADLISSVSHVFIDGLDPLWVEVGAVSCLFGLFWPN